MRPNFTDPWEAARVSLFMEAAQHGRWKLHPFDIDEEYVARETFRVMHDAGDDERRREMGLARIVPPGSYICLKRKAIDKELEGEEGARLQMSTPKGEDPYVAVMSDTPAEIGEHEHAIVNATGRVLIAGLGLGCLVSALLAKPDVTHIDVVEIDADVIALTGPYYDDPRVTIHHDSIHTFKPGPNDRWDYGWHDIWTHISDRNLRPEEAEHGISYGMMFDRFEPYCAMQGAWAFADAQIMEAHRLATRARNKEWEAKFFAADFDTKVDMVFEQEVRRHLLTPDGRSAIPEDQPVPQEFLDFFEEQAQLRTNLERAIREALDSGKLDPEAFEEWRNTPEPLGRPNEETAA